MSPFRPEIEALEQNGITRVALPRITDPKVIPLWFGEGDAVTPQFIRDAAKEREMDLSQAQTPLLVGRTVAALLASDDLMKRTGTIQWVEDLAEEFDVVDENGTRPTEGYARRSEGMK